MHKRLQERDRAEALAGEERDGAPDRPEQRRSAVAAR